MSILSAIKALKPILSKKQGMAKSIQQQEETTVSSSLQTSSKEGANFEFKNGVRYQNEEDVSYILPNDYNELDRLHQQHWLFRYILQRNFHAPIEEDLRKGINVLDSGCGPGTWTLDMAEVYRESKFCGIDASAVFPEIIMPPNVDFAVANLAKTLPFPDNHFDFIFQRLLIMGLKNDDWNNAIKELYRVLKPGGYIEFVECDTGIKNAGPLTSRLNNLLTEMTSANNMVGDIAIQLNNRLKEAGYTNITLKKQDMKFNHTDKGGKLFWEDYRSVFSNNRPILAKFIPEWEDVDLFEKFLDECGEECKVYKTYGVTVHVYNAQKPVSNE